MWEWNCNMENQYGTTFSGNLYQINYCEEGTSNISIVWLGVITNITIDCIALSSRHCGNFMWTPILTIFLLPSFWPLYFCLNIKRQWILCFLSTLAIIFGVLMAFQGLLNLLSVGEPNPFQGQEELTCQWNQPRHPNQRLTKNRNSVSNNLQRLLIHMKWRGYNSVKESVCSKIHLDF